MVLVPFVVLANRAIPLRRTGGHVRLHRPVGVDERSSRVTHFGPRRQQSERQTLLGGHVIFELVMIGVSLGAAVYLGRQWYQANTFARQLTLTVAASRAERDAWRQRAQRVLDGLGKVMSAQFESWALTPTERETALMLLKGHSHKRIGKLTGPSERTIRQHAVSVYRKSGLAGRAELAGFFLGDLVLPESHPLPDPSVGERA